MTDNPDKEGKREVTDEEIGKTTYEEAMKAFFLAIRKPDESAYKAARLGLMQMQTDPNLTDAQRQFILYLLEYCSE